MTASLARWPVDGRDSYLEKRLAVSNEQTILATVEGGCTHQVKGDMRSITASNTSRCSFILLFIDVNTISGAGDTKVNENDSLCLLYVMKVIERAECYGKAAKAGD